MATATKKATRGFTVCCPKCGAEDALTVNLCDVETLSCGECDAETTTDELRSMMVGWTRLLAWLDTAPAADEK